MKVKLTSLIPIAIAFVVLVAFTVDIIFHSNSKNIPVNQVHINTPQNITLHSNPEVSKEDANNITDEEKKMDALLPHPVKLLGTKKVDDSTPVPQSKQEPTTVAAVITDPLLGIEVAIDNYDFKGNIFLDWTRHSYKFDYIGYKSLESVLAVYPNAIVENTMIGPDAANYYKLGDLMRSDPDYFNAIYTNFSNVLFTQQTYL
jgi:hypothetical protein